MSAMLKGLIYTGCALLMLAWFLPSRAQQATWP